MPQANTTDMIGYIAIAFLVVAVLIILALAFFFVYNDFMSELRHLNIEIRRTEGQEKDYWKKQKLRLWLSLIPFVKYR